MTTRTCATCRDPLAGADRPCPSVPGAGADLSHYGLEDEIERLLRRKVWLRSGGYIIIDASEALTAIDVNTGKFVGSTSLSDTILKTNLDAVQEIARQLRLRDIGGMIVLDFIDMSSAGTVPRRWRCWTGR